MSSSYQYQTNSTDFSEVAKGLHMQSCQQIFGSWFYPPGYAGDYSLQKEQWKIWGWIKAYPVFLQLDSEMCMWFIYIAQCSEIPRG